MSAVPSILSYTINRRSGRPEPHPSWAIISLYMWVFAVGAAAFCAMAGYYGLKRGRYDAVPTNLSMALLLAAIAILIRSFLTSRKRSLTIATAQYESAFKALD